MKFLLTAFNQYLFIISKLISSICSYFYVHSNLHFTFHFLLRIQFRFFWVILAKFFFTRMTDVLEDSMTWEQKRELRRKKRQELLEEADRFFCLFTYLWNNLYLNYDFSYHSVFLVSKLWTFAFSMKYWK